MRGIPVLTLAALSFGAAAAFGAKDARADDPWTTPPPGARAPVVVTRPAAAPRPVAPPPSGAARDIERAVASYTASAASDASLVGTGSSLYDRAFWIRGGDFSLGLTFLLQARYEAYLWDDTAAVPRPGGDLSGFSLPRSVVLLHGTAPCNLRYAALLEFGHHGGPADNVNNAAGAGPLLGGPPGGDPPNPLREGWIEWGADPALNVRMGHIKLPSTRQLMAVAGVQQFVDVSMGSSYIGHVGIGYQDRNRDYGVEVHGHLGSRRELEYLLAVSNGDGARRRNVLDGRSDDHLAYSGRVDWDVIGRKTYAEGATRQNVGEWTASLGAWAQYRAARQDRPHASFGDLLLYGADAAVGYGPLAFTGAVSFVQQEESDVGTNFEGMSWLAQASFLFPGTAWEIAGRWSGYLHDTDFAGEFGAEEYAAGVTYYLDGHYDKMTLDAAYITPSENGNILFDVMAGYNANAALARDSDAILLRFQWQLIL